MKAFVLYKEKTFMKTKWFVEIHLIAADVDDNNVILNLTADDNPYTLRVFNSLLEAEQYASEVINSIVED